MGSTALTMAARAGDAGTVAQLLAHGALVDATDGDGNTPLIDAAKYGRSDVVKMLLDNGAKVRIKGKRASPRLLPPRMSRQSIY